MKKVGLKHFTIFTGEHLCWSLFLIKLQAFVLGSWEQYDVNLVQNVPYCSLDMNSFDKNNINKRYLKTGSVNGFCQ